MSRSASSRYDVEAGVRIIRRKKSACTPCCVVFFILSMILAALITALICYFVYRQDETVAREDDDELRMEYEALVKIRDDLKLELKLIFENIENVRIGKPVTIQKHRSRQWFAHWKWFLGGLCGGVFGGFFGSSQCVSNGDLQDNWKLAQNLQNTGFGKRGSGKKGSLSFLRPPLMVWLLGVMESLLLS